MKRVCDILFVVLTAPLWGVVMVVVALLVFCSMGRPVFFLQRRAGFMGREFCICKFRTMRTGEGSDAERLTGMGRFLRKTSLDELPQLLNVLRGEMSLVGPRPLLMRYLPLYNERQAKRHLVRPGITGWAQVSGRNSISWQEKFELDVWYVEHRSLWLDLKILFLTVWNVLARRGISADGEATISFFEGNENE